MKTPKALMVLCDRVEVVEGHKPTLHGLFTIINTTGFPTEIVGHLFVRLWNARPGAVFTVQALDPRGVQIRPPRAIEAEVDGMAEMVIPLRIPAERAGEYRFVLLHNKVVLREVFVDVVHRPSEPAESN